MDTAAVTHDTVLYKGGLCQVCEHQMVLYRQLKVLFVVSMYVYKETWEPQNGEMLECFSEPDNPEDRYAVAIVKESHMVAHVPQTISMSYSIFMRRGGQIACHI